MVDLSLLKKLTIVILSYNRHKYLKRTIKYWLNYNVKLLIIDGSDLKLEEPLLRYKNIEYIHSSKGLYPRYLSTINNINTEFMILSCDDEFYLPSPLSSSIHFLENNPNFSCCGGCALGFGITEDKKFYGIEKYIELKNVNLSHNSATERIESHFSNYLPAHFYSVIRTKIWKKICKNVFEKEYKFYAAFELQVELLILVAGKSKIIPELMWMRNANETSPIRYKHPTKTSSYAYTINDWWHDKHKKKEKEDFLMRMEVACEDLLGPRVSKINKNKINELFELYIDNVYLNQSLLRKFINLIPINVKIFLKSILGYNKIEKKISINNKAKILESKKILVNYSELDQIILSLKSSLN
tara:strand:+ start:2012 stop:3079 length:1068 start_codon:yes stop_codon:yes gene_type:complete